MKKFTIPQLTSAGFGLVILMQLLFFTQISNKLGNINNNFKKNTDELNQKIDKLAPSANDSVISALGQLREELVKYRAEQLGRDQILGLSTMNDKAGGTDAASSLSDTLDRTLAALQIQLPSPTPTAKADMIALKSGWRAIDAYDLPRASSKIVGQIISNQSYLVVGKQTDWIQIKLNSNLSGWVQSSLVDETN